MRARKADSFALKRLPKRSHECEASNLFRPSLELAGLLDELKHKEILDLCDEAGIDCHGNRIDDVKNLSKRLKEYRAFQRRGPTLSTP